MKKVFTLITESTYSVFSVHLNQVHFIVPSIQSSPHILLPIN
ncbi:hypothetical protein RchiOBHm_Chr5g0044461 [Rosa chinensis]|uniref:Uncharacterized protein n=1 Tax=Rosa chinensis TaxID=74649 RepID=A0A2P6QDM8_ROSCH|nr:hypothetical protein RchiOBHm_Chr5g0044461 [Rosa chinensis]